MTEEDEEFNRIEREAAMRKAAVLVAITKKEWIGLTDEEVEDAARYCVKSGQSVNAAIRTIEATLKERNT
jgi:hypothetical protein